MINYKTNNNEETKNIAFNIAKQLTKNSVICLTGELGAGKTVFMSGIAKYFNIEDQVSSPTFTIVNEYNLPNNINSINTIYHFDVYRLSNIDEFIEIGGLDYLDGSLCIIEWGEIIKSILPETTIYVNISKDDNDENLRYIEITGGLYENISN